MASLAFSNFCGRGPRRRAGAVAPTFRGAAVELGPRLPEICWLSSGGRLVLVAGRRGAHKAFETSALQTSIHSRIQYPGAEKLPRETIHGFRGHDLTQSSPAGLISEGI